MSGESLPALLRAPVISEKSTALADAQRTAVFRVAARASKRSIARAVEEIFEVKVEAVRVLTIKPTVARFRGRAGRKGGWKKAYVRLQKGHDINFSEVG